MQSSYDLIAERLRTMRSITAWSVILKIAIVFLQVFGVDGLVVDKHTHHAGQVMKSRASSLWNTSTYFVINLKYRADRWALVSKQFADQGLQPTRVEAVSGKDLVFLQQPSWIDSWNSYLRDQEANTVPRHSKVRLSAVDPKVATVEYSLEFLARYDHNVDGSKTLELSPGEVGCIMSHVDVWHRVAAMSPSIGGISTMACVFEDDVRLTSNFSQKLETDLDELPADTDMLYLTYLDMDPEHDLMTSEHLFVPHALFVTQAYCLTPQGAKHLLKLLPVEGTLDVWLTKKFPELNVFGASPRLVAQHPAVGRGDNDIEHTAYSEGASRKADSAAVAKWWREQNNI